MTMLPANPPSAAPLDLDAPLTELEERLRLHMDTGRQFDLDPLDGVLVVRARPLAALVAAARRGVEDTQDAERYRFLRDNGLGEQLRARDGLMELHFGGERGVTMKSGMGGGYTDLLIDTAIDAARAHPEDTNGQA
jgi:hypothetical protein